MEKEFKINNKMNMISENPDKISVFSYVLNQKWLYGKKMETGVLDTDLRFDYLAF